MKRILFLVGLIFLMGGVVAPMVVPVEVRDVEILGIKDMGIYGDSGLFEKFGVWVVLNVSEAGMYELSVLGFDDREDEEIYLDKGYNEVGFQFDGRLVWNTGINGSHELKVSIYEDGERICRDYFDTGEYNYTDFVKPTPKIYLGVRDMNKPAVEGKRISLKIDVDNRYDSLPLNLSLDFKNWENFADSIEYDESEFYLENGEDVGFNVTFDLKESSAGIQKFSISALSDGEVIRDQELHFRIFEDMNFSEVEDILILKNIENCVFRNYDVDFEDGLVEYEVNYDCGDDVFDIYVVEYFDDYYFDYNYFEILKNALGIGGRNLVQIRNQSFYEDGDGLMWKNGNKHIYFDDFKSSALNLFDAYNKKYPSDVNWSKDVSIIEEDIADYSLSVIGDGYPGWSSSVQAIYNMNDTLFEVEVMAFYSEERFGRQFREEIFEKYENELDVIEIFGERVWRVNRDCNYFSKCAKYNNDLIWKSEKSIVRISWETPDVPLELIDAYLKKYPSDLFSNKEDLILEDIGNWSFIGADIDNNNERWWSQFGEEYVEDAHFGHYNDNNKTVTLMMGKKKASFSLVNFFGMFLVGFEEDVENRSGVYRDENFGNGVIFWTEGDYVFGMNEEEIVWEIVDGYLDRNYVEEVGGNGGGSNNGGGNSGSGGGGSGGSGITLPLINLDNSTFNNNTIILEDSPLDKEIEISNNDTDEEVGRFSFITGAVTGVGDGFNWLGEFFGKAWGWIKNLFG